MTDWADRRLHFIAIGGAGMSGLALVCHQLGAKVSGSDRAESSYTERLRASGLEPRIGHDPDNVPEGAEVVVSTAIADDNPELARAREREQKVLHRGELLAELCSERRLLAVAGTHGKTTTAAMCLHALRAIGEDPSFFLGGELPGAGPEGEAANAGWGEGEWVIAEADESDASFLGLNPEIAVITNLELDHHSRWSSLAELTEAFAAFASGTDGLVVGAEVELPGRGGIEAASVDNKGRGSGERRQIRFALEPSSPSEPSPPADLIAQRIEPEARGGSRFHATGAGIDADVRLAVPGRHNIANALASVGALALVGADASEAAKTLAGFGGVARRLELKGERDGARIYDDYAHHPTEVEAVLAAARDLGPRRLIAAFQPHLYSRTKALATEFGAALSAADEVAVLDVYPAREEPVGELAGVSGRLVAEATADHAGGRPVWWLPDSELAAKALGPRLGEGDVLLTIGAGDISELAEALVAGDGAGDDGAEVDGE
jgi:UDP-N-acetylmuramate--alanine ligase